MKLKFQLLALMLFLTSCNYLKQEEEIADLGHQIRKLNMRIQKYKADSLLRNMNEIKDLNRLEALRIIDSLRFNQPKIYKEIEKEIQSNSRTVQEYDVY